MPLPKGAPNPVPQQSSASPTVGPLAPGGTPIDNQEGQTGVSIAQVAAEASPTSSAPADVKIMLAHSADAQALVPIVAMKGPPAPNADIHAGLG